MSLAVTRFASQIRSRDTKNGDLHAQAYTQISRDADQQAASTAPLTGDSGFALDQAGNLSIDVLDIRTLTARYDLEDPPPIQYLASAGTAIQLLGRWLRLSNKSGGSLTLTATPTIAPSATDGQFIALTNISANPITFQDSGTLAGSGLQLLAPTVTLAQGQTLELRFVSDNSIAKWCQEANGSAGGSGTVTSSGPPAAHEVAIFTSPTNVTGTAVGASNTVLHGNTGADPTFSAVADADITGQISVPHGGTNLAMLTAHALYVGNGASAPNAVGVGATNTVLHGNTGADPAFSAVVEGDISLSNVTTNNASSSAHGFLPKLDEIVQHYLDGTGNWSFPFGIVPALPFTQSPGSPASLSVGSNTVTLSPVPLGVNHTDSNHYLYIDGTGTPEVVLITGGTAVSGAGSGTVTFTCANSHSAGYTVSSATAGIQEAAQLIASGIGSGKVLVPAGTNNVYGPFTCPAATDLFVIGTGLSTIIQVNQTTGTVFTFAATTFMGIANMRIRSSAANGVNVTGIVIGNNNTFTAQNLWIGGLQNGITITTGSTTNMDFIQNVVISGPFASSQVGIGISVGCGNSFVCDCTITAIGRSDLLYGILFDDVGGGSWISGNDVFGASYGLAIIPSSGVAGEAWFTDNAWNSSGTTGIYIQPSGTGSVEPLYFKGDEVSVAGSNGIVIGGGAGTVKNVTFNGVTVLGAQANGIYLGPNASNIMFNNMNVHENSLGAANTYSGLSVDVGVSNWYVNGGKYGGTAGGSGTGFASQQKWGISVLSGSSDHYSIVGANLENNSTAPLSDLGTGAHKVINRNLGIDTATPPTIASASTITLPTDGRYLIYVTGTTTILTINGGRIGQQYTFIKTDTGTLTFGGGGNVPGALTMTQNVRYILSFDGSNFY